MTLSRRMVLAALAGLAARPGAALGLDGPGVPFSPDALRETARQLADRPWQERPKVPQGWRDLTYDQFRMIWFDSQKAVWANSDRPLQLDLFPAGLYFPHAVTIHTVEDGIAREVAFDPSLFDRTDQFPDLPVGDSMGYSGLRLRAQLRQQGIFEEFMVFQGASYFRAIGTGQTYGLSARGLALRTADAQGEEFPDFTAFWVEAPAPGETRYRVHALLDSPSITGAYHFDIDPGSPARVGVEMTVFPRVAVDNVGIGPLTSMFLFDETNRHRFDDFRPGVHDSDGLMIWNGNGERIWRPLANPTRLQVSHFVDDGPRGFGLMQRTRELRDFADFEARYENRPSLWITPRGDWGAGSVQLVEIPADREIYDNIVAYWRPRGGLTPNADGYRFAYDMRWGTGADPVPDVARVTNTRIGKGFDQVKTVVAVDFEDHPALRGDLSDVTIHVSANRGPVSPGVLERNPGTGGPRLAFSFVPGNRRAIELRAQLMRDGRAVSEVWLYRWTAA